MNKSKNISKNTCIKEDDVNDKSIVSKKIKLLKKIKMI